MSFARWSLLATVALGGCALKSDVRRLETQLDDFRAESARQDSVRAGQLREIIALQEHMMDSLNASQRAIKQIRGDVANDLYSVQQQLVQLQELTGQSQRRLSELRTQLETRGEQLEAAQADTGRAGAPAPAGAPSAGAAAASPDQMYEASLAQLRRGSTSTARLGLRELLRLYPQSERAPDAVYFIGESFASENPDSAAVYYRQVVDSFAQSPRAASSLYKLGQLAERRRDTAAAREAYNQVVNRYPRSDEAALARDRLRALGR